MDAQTSAASRLATQHGAKIVIGVLGRFPTAPNLKGRLVEDAADRKASKAFQYTFLEEIVMTTIL